MRHAGTSSAYPFTAPRIDCESWLFLLGGAGTRRRYPKQILCANYCYLMEYIYYLYIGSPPPPRRPIDRYEHRFIQSKPAMYSKTYEKDSRVRSAFSHFIIKWDIERQILNLIGTRWGCDGRREEEERERGPLTMRRWKRALFSRT